MNNRKLGTLDAIRKKIRTKEISVDNKSIIKEENKVYIPYSEKLKHPKWQRKRLEILNRDGFACKLCGDTETELHIHHQAYIKGKQPWEYEDDNFITYCKHCHSTAEIIPGIELLKSAKFFNKDYDKIMTSTIYNENGEFKICINYHHKDGRNENQLIIKASTLKTILSLLDNVDNTIQ